MEVIGVKDNFTASEVDSHISDFNDILNTFEVCFSACKISFKQYSF